MREITLKLFGFSELSDADKKKALEWYRSIDTEYAWADEALASLKAFAKHFGSMLKDYRISWSNSSYSSAGFSDKELDEEELGRLVGELKHDGSCQFTGYCADDDANEGAVKAYEAGERDVQKILQAGFESWLKSAQSDAEHQWSDEGIADALEANEHEFTEDGKHFRQLQTA